MPWSNQASYRFHYRVQGNFQRPKLLFLHGFMGHCGDFDAAIAKLVSSFCCLSVDLPGHGQTEVLTPQGYEMASTAQGLVALLNQLAFSPCYGVGYSMGGRLALYLACSFPRLFTGVLLESASPGLATVSEQTQRRQQDEMLAQRLETEDWSYFVQQWYEQPLFASLRQSAAFETLIQKRQHNRPLELAQVLRGMGTGSQPSLWGLLPRLSIPVTLLVGALDAKFVQINQQMANDCPSAQTIIAPNCGHGVHHESPHVFVQAIEYSFNPAAVH